MLYIPYSWGLKKYWFWFIYFYLKAWEPAEGCVVIPSKPTTGGFCVSPQLGDFPPLRSWFLCKAFYVKGPSFYTHTRQFLDNIVDLNLSSQPSFVSWREELHHREHFNHFTLPFFHSLPSGANNPPRLSCFIFYSNVWKQALGYFDQHASSFEAKSWCKKSAWKSKHLISPTTWAPYGWCKGGTLTQASDDDLVGFVFPWKHLINVCRLETSFSSTVHSQPKKKKSRLSSIWLYMLNVVCNQWWVGA